MKRSKKSDTIKQSPFNINISFNINPKNVNQSQNHTNIKIPQNPSQHQQLKTNLKNNADKNKSNYPPNSNGHSLNINNRPISQYLSAESQQKKQLQQLKKNFMAKINNIDIVLPSTLNKEVQKKEDNLDESSIMSEKMGKFESEEKITTTLQQPPNLNMNFNAFQPSKSKILNNNTFAKAYNIQTKKKDKNSTNKHSLSQVKHQSKLLTHHKGQSCFTDRKYLQKNTKRRKLTKKQVKQQNLKQKLQRFKVDLMKLALVYEQTEVLKTKMSSQYHNIRSREISKENVIKMTEGEENEHFQEIRQFQNSKNDQLKPFQQKDSQILLQIKKNVNQSLDQLISQVQETQSFADFKHIYQGLQREDIKPQQPNLYYYKNLQEDLEQEKKQASQNEFFDKGQVISNKKQNQERTYMHQPIDAKRSHQLQTAANKQIAQLSNFVQFAKSKLGQQKGVQFKEMIEILFKQYLKKEQIASKTDEEDFEENQVMIQEIDDSIDKQLSIIPTLRLQLAQEFDIKSKVADDLQFWEQTYKQELLKIKGKMWREYYNIKNEIENRITSGNSSKTIKTKKQKKVNKIMKCLSQKLISKHYQKMTPFQQKVEENFENTDQIQTSLLNLKQVTVNSYLSHYRQQDEHLTVQMSEQQLSQEQLSNVPISFINYQPQDIMLIEQKQIPLQQTKEQKFFKFLKQDDKEDIFQFIFLDLCIEMYQTYVEKEGRAQNSSQIQAAQRILNRIKQYIAEQKQRKKEQENKKIGISTNINTIRGLLSKLVAFLLNQNLISVITSKLNSALGPSQAQILRSLRLPVFEQAQQQENNELVQQEDLLVLDPTWFVRFENQVIRIQQLSFCKYYESQERDQQRINYLRNCTHIHHKAIYDCLNQHLDYYRVYGLWGRPFSWKTKNQFNHTFDIAHTRSSMSKAQSEVIRCATFACGLMVNKEQSLIKDIANDPQYVRRLQDERVYKLLQNFVIEMQEKWFFHDDQQAQILIQVSHIIWTIVIKEVIRELVAFGKF